MKAILLLLFLLQLVRYGELAVTDVDSEQELTDFLTKAKTPTTNYDEILFYKDSATPVAQRASKDIKDGYVKQMGKIKAIAPDPANALKPKGLEALRVYYLRMEQKYLSDLTTACPATKLSAVRALTTLDVNAAKAQLGIAPGTTDYNLNELSQGYKDARICMADDFSTFKDDDKKALATLHHLFMILLETIPPLKDGGADLGEKGDLEVARINLITNVEQSAKARNVLFETDFGEEWHEKISLPNGDPMMLDMARIYAQKLAMLNKATTAAPADKTTAIEKLKEAYGGELVRLVNAEKATPTAANLFDFIFDAFNLKPTTNARLYKDYKAKKDAIDEVATHKLSIPGINDALDELMLAYGDNLVDSINTVKNPNNRAAEATDVFNDDELPTTATALDDFEKIFDEKKAAIQKAIEKKKPDSELALAVLIGSYLRRRTDTAGHPQQTPSAQKTQLIAHIDTITRILELKADADKRKVFKNPTSLKDLDAAFDAIKAQLDTIEKDVDAKVTGAKLVDAAVDAVVKDTLHQLINLRTPILIDLISAEKAARPTPADRKAVAESIFDTFSKTPAKMDDLRTQYETKKTGIQAAIKATPTDANANKAETVLMDAFLRILERANDHPFQSDPAKRTDLLKNIDIISDILEANLANDNLKMLNNPADLAQLATNFKTMKDALDAVKAATATSANVNTDVEEIYNKAFAALDTARIDLEKRLQPQPVPGGSPGGTPGSPGAQPGGPAQPGQPGAPGQTFIQPTATQPQTFGPPAPNQFKVGTVPQEMAREFDGSPPVRMPDTQCMDASTNCLKNIRLCHLESYIQVMHSNCARTCRVCFPASEPCDDLNKFDCPTWNAQGFCQSTKRSKALKMLQCAKSCGLCPP